MSVSSHRRPQPMDIPKTRNGKITEIAARDALNGRDSANTEALDYIRAFAS